MNRFLQFTLAIIGSILLSAAVINTNTDPEIVNKTSVEGVICHYPAIDAFAEFAKDPDFKMAHNIPAPIQYNAEGKSISFKVEGGQDGNAYFSKGKKKGAYLLMIHEWWGLNDYVRKEADYWSKTLGLNVMAIDLYDGKVATTREDASKYMQGMDNARAEAIIKGAMKHAGKDAKFASIGWCFGGGWSLQTAIIGEEKMVGCVMFYGMPEKDIEKLKKLNTDVLCFIAEQDKWITPAVGEEFKQNMKSAGKMVEVKTYDAAHAFANPSRDIYNEEADKDSRMRTEAYLKKAFQF